MDQLREVTQRFRAALREAGVPCTVRMVRTWNSVQVRQTRPDQEFTSEEQRTFRQLAVDFGFTGPRGLPVVVDQDTDPFGSEFEV